MEGLRALATTAREEGDDAAATALLAESLAVARQAGDRRGAATSLFLLGWGALAEGDYATARRHLETSLSLCRQTGEGQAQVASVLNRLGDVLRAEGDVLTARALHADALATWRAVGYPRGIADALGALGEAAVALGDPATARACYDEALAASRQPSGEQFPGVGVAEVWPWWPAPSARPARPASTRSRRWPSGVTPSAGAATSIASPPCWRTSRPWPPPTPSRRGPYAWWARPTRCAPPAGSPRYPLHQVYLDRGVAPARRALDAAAAAAALAEGRAMTLDQAITEAVDWAPATESGASLGGAPSPPAGPRALAHEPAGGRPGRLRLDVQTYEVWRGEERLAPALSPQEFALVAYLYTHQERVCTRRELGDALWGAHAWDLAMLHNLVRRVKAKLEPAPGRPRYLHAAGASATASPPDRGAPAGGWPAGR